ncbi:MAG: WD40 repeat domain-containing protein, partial [Chloroflexota bacterium]
ITRKLTVPPNPYRGLFAFREEDAAYFFGREVYTDRLAEMVDRQPLVALIGPSGSGKSSVFHAGLLACLRQHEAWQVTSFRPGNRPIHALAAALLPLLEPTMTETEVLVETVKLARAFRDEDLSLTDVVGRIQQKDQSSHRFLLLADQFEELYAYDLENPDRQRFVDLLLEFVASQQNKLQATSCFAFALRADFLDLVLGYRPFSDALQDSTLILGPMTQKELTWAIEKPAKKQGVSFEHGLLERILADLGREPGNLPLLEFVLEGLWKRQNERQLTHDAYNEIGRVDEALARYADRVYSGLEPGHQERARQIFVQLVWPGRRTSDTRRMSHRSELGEENWALAQDLADARLVVIDRDPTGRETVELVHETLIGRWDRLQAWLDEDRAFRVWQERMRIAVQQWEASDRDEGALLRGALLTEAERWLKDRRDQLGRTEVSFVEAGCTLRDRRERNRRRTIIALAAGLLLTIALTTLAIWQWRSARQAKLVAEREQNQTQVALSHLLATQAQFLLDEQIDLSLLLALEALNKGDSPETRGALLATLGHRPYSRSFQSDHQDKLRIVAISPDGRTLASGGLDNRIILWDLVSGQARGSPLTGHTGFVRSLAFSPDGLTLASGSSDETVILWDLAIGQPAVPPLAGHVGDIWSVDFSPSGQLLASAAADGAIRFWDPRTGQPVGDPVEAHSEAVNTIAFSPTGRLLASAGRNDTALVWDVSAISASVTSDSDAPVVRQLGQPLKGHSGLDRALAFSPDGRILAMDGDDNTIQLWDISEVDAAADPESDPADQHGIVIRPILALITDHEDWITSLAFGVDNRTLVSADASGQLILWDLGTPGATTDTFGYESRSLGGQGAPIWDVVASQDGGTFVSADGSGRITLWELAGQHPLARQFSGPGGLVRSIALDPAGQILAVGDSAGNLFLYDVDTSINTFGQLIGQTQTVHTPYISVSFSPNENVLATAGGGELMLWQVESLEPESLPELDQDNESWYAMFSPDGHTLAVFRNDNKILLWDLDTGDVLQQLLTEDIVGVPAVFSQGGDWLAG